MEDLVKLDPSHWDGRSVFVTGHTGFKGGWLTVWLHLLGARIHGYALDPPTVPSLFQEARIGSLLSSDTRADVADLKRLTSSMREARPEVVFHLAAQPLVRDSYGDPAGTFATNTLGTAHVLDAARATSGIRAIVLVATDKVYANDRTDRPFRESDPLGGHDPYSASKAAAEIVAASYRSSFFSGAGRHPARLASVRAGNVIGGGDWARDRLIPDCLRAFESGRPVRLRNPSAVRPWQHVLEPLSGYIRLAERLAAADGEAFATSWNFGPDSKDEASVARVADLAAEAWGSGARVEHVTPTDGLHEAGLLRLDTTQARTALQWAPRWPIAQAVRQTVSWHRAWTDGADALGICTSQIGAYQSTEDR